MKNLMEKVIDCNEKKLAVLFLLTVLTLFLAPGVKAHAAGTATDAKDLRVGDHLVEGDPLTNSQWLGQDWGLSYINPADETTEEFDLVSKNYTVKNYFGTSEWKVEAVSGNVVILVYWPLGTDVSTLQVNDKLPVGKVLHHSDTNEWKVHYAYPGGTNLDVTETTTEDINGNYTVKSLQSVQEWTITDIDTVGSVKTVVLDGPQTGRNASTVQPDEVLDAETALYTLHSRISEPWYMNYQDPNGGSPIREPITATDYIVKKYWGGGKNGRFTG